MNNIFNYERFKKMVLESMEILPDGKLSGTESIGTKENPIEITGKDYMRLEDPEFIGQTKPDENYNYSILWYSDGLYYLTRLNLLA
jgi:hypothetical protein